MISLEKIRTILFNESPAFVEELAQQSKHMTQQLFGRAISLYAPLYLSNYCENICLYCGFHKQRQIKRDKLTLDGMKREMGAISRSGIQNILLLTGESRRHTPVDYILESVDQAKQFFPSISVEIYPLEENEYRQLYLAGVDGVTLYQETYNRDRYLSLHIAGLKRDYNYRYQAPERMARAGIRMISLGVLLGLWDVAEDIAALYSHLAWLEKNFPGVEYSLSFPRVVPVNHQIDFVNVSDITLVKLICLARICFPRVGINLSTRENARFRDHTIEIGVTKISAASRTTVGGYADEAGSGEQFHVQDNRSVQEIVNMLKQRHFDPVFTDWRRIPNR